MAIAEELKVVIRAEVEQAMRDMGRFDRSLGELGTKVDNVGRTLSRTLTPAILAGAGAAVKFAADIERQQEAFAVLLGDVEAGTRLFEELKEFSASTPLQLEDITKASQTLLAFGTASEDVIDRIGQLGDVAQGNAEKLDRITLAFGKIQARGKASMEEMNVLIEAGVPIIATLAENFGVAESAIFDMVSSGEVRLADMEAALDSLTGQGGQFEGMMERISQTTAGKFSTAVDNLKLAAAELGAELLPLINDILDRVTSLAKGFTELDDGTKRLILTIAGIAAGAGPAIRGIRGITTALNVLKANPIIGVIAGVTALVGWIVRLVRNAETWEESMASVAQETRDNKAAIEGLIGPLEDVNSQEKIGAELYNQAIGLYPDLREEIDATTTSYEDLAQAVKDQNKEMYQDALAPIAAEYGRAMAEVVILQSKIAGNNALSEEHRQALELGRITEYQYRASQEAIDRENAMINNQLIPLREQANSMLERGNSLWSEWRDILTDPEVEEALENAGQAPAAPSGAGGGGDGSSLPVLPPVAVVTLEQYIDRMGGLGGEIVEANDALDGYHETAKETINSFAAQMEMLREIGDRSREAEASEERRQALISYAAEMYGVAREQVEFLLRDIDGIDGILARWGTNAEEFRKPVEGAGIVIDEMDPKMLAIAQRMKETEAAARELEDIAGRINSRLEVWANNQWMTVEAAEAYRREVEQAEEAMRRLSMELAILGSEFLAGEGTIEDRTFTLMEDSMAAVLDIYLPGLGTIFSNIMEGFKKFGKKFNEAGPDYDETLSMWENAAKGWSDLFKRIGARIRGDYEELHDLLSDGNDTVDDAFYEFEEMVEEYAPSASDPLRDELDALQDVLSEEQRIRQEAMRQLDREFSQEYEVLRDLWDRNLISTEEFQKRMEELNTEYDTELSVIQEPVEEIRDQIEAIRKLLDAPTTEVKIGGGEYNVIRPIDKRLPLAATEGGGGGDTYITITGDSYGIDSLGEKIENAVVQGRRRGRITQI